MTKRSTIDERAYGCSVDSGKKPSQVLLVNASRSCLCSNVPKTQRKGRKLLKRCPGAGTTAGNLAPSRTAAASSPMVEATVVDCGRCFAEAMSTQRALDRGFDCLGLPGEWKDTATRRNAWIAARTVISVIALTVG